MAARKKKTTTEPSRGSVGVNRSRKGKGWTWMVITPDGRTETSDETYLQVDVARKDGERVLSMARGETR